MTTSSEADRILSIDIGGSHIKATILDENGNLQIEYERVPTPESPDPKMMMQLIGALVSKFPAYNKIAVGFPGYIKAGVVMTAPNLGTDSWKGFNLQQVISETLKQPALVVNDADMQGLGVIAGKGLEMVITLGTGFGTALFMNGILLPHLELAHHPVSKDRVYDDYIGDKALEKAGLEKWNKRVIKVLDILKTVFNYDHLFIGGGNAKKMSFQLDDNMSIVTNKDGIKGGARLWKMKSIASL